MTSSIITHPVDQVVRQMLVDLSQGSAPNTQADWPVYASQQPDIPDNLIIVRVIGGRLHGRSHPSGATRLHYGVEVAVRASRASSTGTAGHTSAWEKIGLVCKALDESVLNRIVTVETTVYTVHAMTRVGDISKIGPDQTTRERYLFAVPYNLSITQR